MYVKNDSNGKNLRRTLYVTIYDTTWDVDIQLDELLMIISRMENVNKT